MALAFFGIQVSQEEIAHHLGHIPGAGTPARNILRLSQYGVKVQYYQEGSLAHLEESLRKGAVAVAFVRTGELPYWEEDVPHAIVVVGVEAGVVYINDPSFEHAPVPVWEEDFLLAWEEFGCQWAVISNPHSENF